MDEAGIQAEIGITLNKLSKQLAQAEVRMHRTAQKMEQDFARANKSVERGFRKTTGAMNQFNGGIRGVSLQLSQVLQQGSVTGDYLRALSVQLPDLALGFGTVGIAAGALAGVLLPLAADLIGFGDGAKSAEDQLKDLIKSINDLKEARDRAATGPTSLLGEYDDLAGEARVIFEISRQMAAIRAQTALDDTARRISGALGVSELLGIDPALMREAASETEEFTDKLVKMIEKRDALSDSDPLFSDVAKDVESMEAALGVLTNGLGDLGEMLGVTEAQAREIVTRFAELEQAEGAREQADLMIELADYIKTSSDNLKDAEKEGRAFYDQLVQAALTALELSAVDYQSALNDGTESAREFKEELAAALALQNRLNQQNSKEYSGRGSDPRSFGSDDYTNELGYTSVDDRIEQFERRSRRSRGRGGSNSSKELNEAKRLFAETRTEAEKYQAELERINELHRQFPQIITEEVRDRAIVALEESASKLGEITKGVESSFESAFTSFVAGAGNAQDAARSLAQDLLRLASRAAFNQFEDAGILQNLIGAIFPSAQGNVFSGGSPVTAFAQGGVVNGPTFFPMRGSRTGLMGEAGPEAIMPLVRMPGGDLGVRSAGGGGNVSVPISVVVENHGAEVQTRQSQDGRSLRLVIRNAVTDDILTGRLSKPMQQRFGTTDKARGG